MPPERLWTLLFILLLPLVMASACEQSSDLSGEPAAAEISGELKTWHRVTISFDGPESSETATPNPFTNYRLDVTFTHGNQTVVVPGFYAADGDAANSSAESGSIWQVHFSPNEEGEWSYKASFRAGQDVAIATDPMAGEPTAFDGASGSFTVLPSDKGGQDLRHHGLLQYVGEHHYRFAGSGTYYLKGGADSPENFLAYDEIDGTFDADAGSGSYEQVGTFIHQYQPHVQDWRNGDPSWKDGKGKGIIGALNYLAGKGMNSVYFLTYNTEGGDGRDTWMWTDVDERERFDVSKLAQWEIVFAHMDRLGIMLHVVTQETENDRNLGGSVGLNPVRELYYRELVARFSHHNAVIWNLGEENNTPDADRKMIAGSIRSLDPYDHPITVHTKSNRAMWFYDGILGDPNFEATSIQADMGDYNRDAIVLRKRSERAGRKWAIFGDEQQPAWLGAAPDAVDPTHDLPRKQALWETSWVAVPVWSGISAVVTPVWTSTARLADARILWDQTRYALDFFRKYLPFWEMEPDNGLAFAYGNLVLAKPGQTYAVYLPTGGHTTLDLQSDEGTFKRTVVQPKIRRRAPVR